MESLTDFNRLAESQCAMCTDWIRLLYYELPGNYSDSYRSYDSLRLCTILEGSKEVSINQAEAFRYQQDGFILLPPHSTLHMFVPEKTRALVYEFDEKIIEHVSQKVGDQLQFSMDKASRYNNYSFHQQTNRIKALTNRIEEISIEKDQNKFLVDLACQELVYELLKLDGCHEIMNTNNNHPIKKALKLMNEYPESIESLQSIAHEVNMSASNFSVQFKIITDLTPSEYLTQIRIKKARQLLQHMSVTETAFELGYQNISHFIKLFKSYYGVTPKQYQKQHNVHL